MVCTEHSPDLQSSEAGKMNLLTGHPLAQWAARVSQVVSVLIAAAVAGTPGFLCACSSMPGALTDSDRSANASTAAASVPSVGRVSFPLPIVEADDIVVRVRPEHRDFVVTYRATNKSAETLPLDEALMELVPFGATLVTEDQEVLQLRWIPQVSEGGVVRTRPERPGAINLVSIMDAEPVLGGGQRRQVAFVAASPSVTKYSSAEPVSLDRLKPGTGFISFVRLTSPRFITGEHAFLVVARCVARIEVQAHAVNGADVRQLGVPTAR